MDDENLKLWPFIEAKKIIKRYSKKDKSTFIFQTGYGPSGLPHIGTFGEVLRTSMVIKAFKHLTGKDVELYVFSDDMDGLRKVPANIPNQKIIEKHLEKPLCDIPDPFKKFSSFADYNNHKLNEFLLRFDFNYQFKSSTKYYKSGLFNSGLELIFDNYDKIINVILPTLRKERRQTYSPFLPICQNCGKVLQVKIEELNKKSHTIVYYNPFTKQKEESSIYDGKCKLQWKVDWAMRWRVLGVDYEMNGKDLIESFMLSSKINKIIGGTPPCNYTYEHFLDEKGEKISKSLGNGISVDDWLKFSPKESLEIFMFQNPNRAKRLHFDVIPKMTDEYLRFKADYCRLDPKQKPTNPVWFLDTDLDDIFPQNITFNMILNLASVCNAENTELLWNFIENYNSDIKRDEQPTLNKLLEFGVEFYKEFILPNKKYRKPSVQEEKGFKELVNFLIKQKDDIDAETIQTKIYDIGMSLEYKSLKEWFGAFYEVILGQKQGPRLGSFIKFYGIKKTVLLLNEKLDI